MTRIFTIQEMSNLTSLTIRTLHYYDEIHLLKANRLKNGHRYYSESDLIRLQQIITLKYLGFSLAKIKSILLNPHFNLIESIKIQHQAFIEEENRIKKVLNLFNYVLHQHTHENQINWNTLTKIIEIIEFKKDVQDKWYETLFSINEQEIFIKLAKKRTKKWKHLFEEIKKNVNLNPKSKTAQYLVKKWHMLADETYNHYPELKNKLWEAYKAGVIPGVPYDTNVIHFLTEANHYLNK